MEGGRESVECFWGPKSEVDDSGTLPLEAEILLQCGIAMLKLLRH